MLGLLKKFLMECNFFVVFLIVADALKTLDPNLFGKWTHYLNLKAAFYEAYVSRVTRGRGSIFSPYYISRGQGSYFLE